MSASRAGRAPGETAAAVRAESRIDTSPRSARDFSRISVHAATPTTLQPKLRVNVPGDAHEQEADRIADRVMRISDAQPQPQPQSSQPRGAGPIVAPPLVHDVLRSPGQPLDAATRAFMEPRFGRDFSRVRIHTGSRASDAAQSINARAFALGPAVVFGPGQYAPHTDSGRRLLAHELTHVVQQRLTVGLNHVQCQTTDAVGEYDVVKFGERGEANLYRLSLVYGVPFSVVKQLNPGLEKRNWLVRPGDLINLPRGSLAKAGDTQHSKGQSSPTGSITAPVESGFGGESSSTDTATGSTELVSASPPILETKKKTEKRGKHETKAAAVTTGVETSKATEKLAHALLQKHATVVIGSDFYIPYSLDEKAIGKELAEAYSHQPAVVQAVLDLTDWADRDDVAFEMSRSLYARQMLDPLIDTTMLRRLRFEISNSLFLSGDKKAQIKLLDMALQVKGVQVREDKNANVPTWGDKFLKEAKEFEGAAYKANYCASKEKMKEHGVCNELVYFAVTSAGAPMSRSPIGHPDWYKDKKLLWDWMGSWDTTKNAESGWVVVSGKNDVTLGSLIEAGGTTEGQAAGLLRGDLLIDHKNRHEAFYVRHGKNSAGKQDIFMYDSNAYDTKEYPSGVGTHTVRKNWNAKKVVTVYRYSPK